MRRRRLSVPGFHKYIGSVSGNVAIITAAFAPVIAVMAAFAVDTGAISTQKRALQGHADMAAMAAASDLLNAETAARTYLSDNGRGNVSRFVEVDDGIRATDGPTLRVETGRYTADRTIAPSSRFVAGAAPINAARVRLSEPQERYFDFIGGPGEQLDVSGVAVLSAEAGISVGSRLARLDGGLLNSLLSELTGAEISLSAMSYEALLKTDIDMLDSLEWLAEDLQLTAVTYDDVLSTNIRLDDFLAGLANGAGDDVLARQALRTLSQRADDPGRTLAIGDLVELGTIAPRQLGDPPPGPGVRLKALPLLMASAITANGENQIDLDLSADIGQLVNIDASLLVGERPQGQSWFALSGMPGHPVSTAQLRLSLVAEVGSGILFNEALVRLPMHIDLASAEARITDIDCAPGERQARQVNVAVQPSLARLRIAELGASGSGEPATLINGRLLRVKGFADVRAANPSADTLRFLGRDIGGDPKTAGTDSALQGLLSSAISSLDYQVDAAGLGLLSSKLLTLRLGGLVEDLAAPLDEIVFSLTSALGLGLGEADVWVHTAICNSPVLVQ